MPVLTDRKTVEKNEFIKFNGYFKVSKFIFEGVEISVYRKSDGYFFFNFY